MNLKVTQSGVDEHFKMAVPVYFESAEGKFFFLGRIKMVGNQPVELHIPLVGMKTKPKRALVNYYYDVLCSPS